MHVPSGRIPPPPSFSSLPKVTGSCVRCKEHLKKRRDPPTEKTKQGLRRLGVVENGLSMLREWCVCVLTLPTQAVQSLTAKKSSVCSHLLHSGWSDNPVCLPMLGCCEGRKLPSSTTLLRAALSHHGPLSLLPPLHRSFFSSVRRCSGARSSYSNTLLLFFFFFS